MALQNRVDPAGNIISTTARGTWLGNRGVIHNEQKQIVRPFKIKAWIICMLEFRGRHRNVMTPDRWTELFFLDEATAFSAGHRPCFQCRYADHRRFKEAWLKGNPEYGFDDKTPINRIDEILQTERISQGRKVTYTDDVNHLPDGTFIQLTNEPWLAYKNQIHHWTPFGYDNSKSVDALNEIIVLTPRSIVNAFRAGYKVQISIEN
ncbi:hypothetical protein [Mucilaginibacter sp. L3T2-6]|uniref:hypothetical protein n=1 Tax=Mucilaginibacter sp. L3T2-6 TaxID=3062491 RepID=UPI0026765EB7|nr:hypothetical protein [Mucilaginibacter sp. L3T2-6]MDO3643085.1 hypothetical protein [Mucilaginibacter sp. L3T2-6]MDV6215852.1 hypothetical protein [Mucilaginibacter sp. L3T2-6]